MLDLLWEWTIVYGVSILKKCWLTLQLPSSPSPDSALFWTISDVRVRMGLSLEPDPLQRGSAVLMFSRTNVDWTPDGVCLPRWLKVCLPPWHVCLHGHLPWSQGKLGTKSGGRKGNAHTLGRKPGWIRKRSGIMEGWRSAVLVGCQRGQLPALMSG